MRKQKGGKIIGKGFTATIISPAIKIKGKYGNKVSKIFDVSKNGKSDMDTVFKEYELANIIHENDPTNTLFIGAIAIEIIENNKTVLSKQNKEDLKKIFGRIPPRGTAINMVMEKGYDFRKIIKQLTKEDVIKTLLYLLNTISNMSDIMKIGHADLHIGNIMFAKSSKNKIHPVIVDFTPKFIFLTKKDYKNLVKDRWTEVLYPKFHLDFPALHTALYGKTITETTKKNLKEFHNMSEKDFKKIVKFMKNIDSERGYKILINKMMMLYVAKAFRYNKHITSDKKLSKIIKKMLDVNPITRLTSIRATEMLKKIHPYKEIEDLEIDITKEKIKI